MANLRYAVDIEIVLFKRRFVVQFWRTHNLPNDTPLFNIWSYVL